MRTISINLCVSKQIIHNGFNRMVWLPSIGARLLKSYKDTPIYDGFSNICYHARISEAFSRFYETNDGREHPFDVWESMIFHLPYAYHARRIFISLFEDYLHNTGRFSSYQEKYADVWSSLEILKKIEVSDGKVFRISNFCK